MVAANPLTERFRRLEDAHYFETEMRLRKEFDQFLRREHERKALSHASAIDDPELLDRLIDEGFSADTFPALALVPIAMLAWASGDVSERERKAVLKVVVDSGLTDHAAALEMFEGWLVSRPSEKLMDLWREVTERQLSRVRWSIREAIGDRYLRQATEVASASGGFLGFGSVCYEEQALLERIRSVYG